MKLGLSAFVVFALGLQAPQLPDLDGLDARLATLGTLDADQAEADLRVLVEAGEAAAEHSLAGFAEVEPLARRRRAWIVRSAGGASSIAAAIAALVDPDPEVRAQLIAFLGRADLAAHALAARIEALCERAVVDPQAARREQALAALADLDEPAAFDALDSTLDVLIGAEQVEAARLLAQRARAREAILRRVGTAFGAQAHGAARALPGVPRALDGETLATLLAAYGRALAETEAGGESARDRAPLLVAARDPDPRIRRAAELGFESLLRRLSLLGDAARADRILAGFAAQGLDPRTALYQRARFALLLGAQPDLARAPARELRWLARAGGDRTARTWEARALQLAALADLAEGDAQAADAALAEEIGVLDGLLAQRVDLQAESLRGQHVEWLHQRALCELTALVRVLAFGPVSAAGQARLAGDHGPPAARARTEAVQRALRVHTLELEAQLCAWRGKVDAANGLDPLLDADLSPFTLLFENPRHPAWPAARSLALRAELGRALASVAPLELLGFEPAADRGHDLGADLGQGVRDPLADPLRRALLQRTQNARLDLLRKQFNELVQKVLPEAAGNPAGIEPGDERALQQLEMEMEDVLESNRAGRERDDWSALAELRVPSSSALWLARELRNEGRAAESRQVAAAMRAALEANPIAQRYIWSLELEAEIEMTIGSSYSDDDEPEKAEVELVKAVERLEAIEKLIAARGFGGGALLRVRALRCGALVGLAVNANVKLQDVPKAIAYFERAFELRQDDFMRVLLACYRARAARADEARALLRSVVPSPGTHYNMACTWALLGETELALGFLRRDFEENQLSEGALAKQKEWARRDPDLKSLRADPRFRTLVE